MRRLASATLVLSALASVPVVVLAPQLITLFFGRAFAGAAAVARVLLVAADALSTNRTLESQTPWPAAGNASAIGPPPPGTVSRVEHRTHTPPLAGRRVLITGGAGFIGSHLAEALLGRGCLVHVIDDLSTGGIQNIRALKEDRRFGYTVDSCHDRRVVAELIDDADFIFHLAAAVGVQLIVDSPVRTIETNVHCTEVVLEAAGKKGRPVFIASTSEVYGKSRSLPFREDGDIVIGATTKGRWAYACSKALDEFLAIAYHRERGLPIIVGRLFNTVGPRQTGRYGMVVPTLVRQALSGRPITVFGSGEQRRCFCHVADVVRALCDLSESEQLYGEVFNIGSTEEVTILELARRIKETTGSESEIVFVPYDQAYSSGFEDMERRQPDTTKIAAAIGWAAAASLDQIIADVIAHERVPAHRAA